MTLCLKKKKRRKGEGEGGRGRKGRETGNIVTQNNQHSTSKKEF